VLNGACALNAAGGRRCNRRCRHPANQQDPRWPEDVVGYSLEPDARRCTALQAGPPLSGLPGVRWRHAIESRPLRRRGRYHPMVQRNEGRLCAPASSGNSRAGRQQPPAGRRRQRGKARPNLGQQAVPGRRESYGRAGLAGNGVVYGPNDQPIQQRVLLPEPEQGGMAKVRKVAVGGTHACAWMANGSVACWGMNNSGNLGRGFADAAPHPRPAYVYWPPTQ